MAMLIHTWCYRTNYAGQYDMIVMHGCVRVLISTPETRTAKSAKPQEWLKLYQIPLLMR